MCYCDISRRAHSGAAVPGPSRAAAQARRAWRAAAPSQVRPTRRRVTRRRAARCARAARRARCRARRARAHWVAVRAAEAPLVSRPLPAQAQQPVTARAAGLRRCCAPPCAPRARCRRALLARAAGTRCRCCSCWRRWPAALRKRNRRRHARRRRARLRARRRRYRPRARRFRPARRPSRLRPACTPSSSPSRLPT